MKINPIEDIKVVFKKKTPNQQPDEEEEKKKKRGLLWLLLLLLLKCIIIASIAIPICLSKKPSPHTSTHTYTVTFNSNGGSDVTSQTVNEGGLVTKPTDPTKDFCSFDGWYKEEALTYTWNFESDVVNSDTTLYAKWTGNEYHITLSGVLDPITVRYGELIPDVDVPAASVGYAFAGYFDQVGGSGNKYIGSDGKGVKPYDKGSDSTLYPYFELASYTITYNLFGGTNSLNNPSSYTILTSDIVLEDPTYISHIFKGWFSDSAYTTPVTTIPQGTTGDITLYAKWAVSFGMYPQSKVTDATLIAELDSLAGTLPSSGNPENWTDYGYYISGSISSYMWYQDIEYNSDKYRGVYFTKYRPDEISESDSADRSEQDNHGYFINTIYWFKYEPLIWDVLKVEDNKSTLVSNMVIDSQQFFNRNGDRSIGGKTIRANNWEYSDIRTFLNEDFYDIAFTATEKDNIQTTLVDNQTTTRSDCTAYVSNNTYDKVYLLSYADIINEDYGFENTEDTTLTRVKGVTDYALSQGTILEGDPAGGRWLLRSPGVNKSHVNHVTINGRYLKSNTVSVTYTGVMPAITVTFGQ